MIEIESRDPFEVATELNNLSKLIADDYAEYPDAFIQYHIYNQATGQGISIERTPHYASLEPMTGCDFTITGDCVSTATCWHTSRYDSKWMITVEVQHDCEVVGTCTIAFRDTELKHVVVERKLRTEDIYTIP